MKNKIYKYDFLIVGAGLVGSLAAIALHQKKYKVLVIEKNELFPKDERTLAVNANSRDFLKDLGIWKDLKSNFESIDRIIIKDYVEKDNLIFHNNKESTGSVIFNKSLLNTSRELIFSLWRSNVIHTYSNDWLIGREALGVEEFLLFLV